MNLVNVFALIYLFTFCRVVNRQLGECRRELDEAEARCLRGTRSLETERVRYRHALATNSLQRQVIDDLKGDALEEHDYHQWTERTVQLCVDHWKERIEELQQLNGLLVDGHDIFKSEADERQRAMAAANTNLTSQLEALHLTNVQQLRTAQHDRDALNAYTTVIEEHRDTLASRCTQLQAERDRLAKQCDELKADVARVTVLTAENKELRTKIKLVSTESRLRLTQIETERALDAEKLEKNADLHRKKMLELQEEAKGQQAKVEQESLAWHLKWMEEAKQNYKRGRMPDSRDPNNNHQQGDLPDPEDHDNNDNQQEWNFPDPQDHDKNYWHPLLTD